ncbi:MAG: hypothetical protein FJX74_00250 [Armatimonadetes bacterium]|nr:hypothetical protein [Armatimonadota bacterium]
MLLLVLLVSSTGSADGLLVIDDCEGKVGPWRGTEIVSEPVHGGGGALRWEVARQPTLDSPQFLGDWTAFDELRFWAHLDRPYDFSIPLVFPTDGGYWITDWKLDWTGWKEQRFRLADCRKAYEPEGWERISSLGFRAQGYGQGPVPEGLVIVFDDVALHAPGELPETSLEAWLARERRERVSRLKAQGNPYYLSVLDSLRNAKADPGLPQEVTSSWQFSGLASQALASAWAAAWEESPRKGDATLIARASALIDFCLSRQVDGSWFYSQKWESGDPNSDRFALGPLMDAIWWLRQLPTGEAQWPEWEAPLRALVDFQYENWGKRANHAWGQSATQYPNQDVFHLYEMALADRWWGDAQYRQSLEETLAGLEAHLLPEGGLNYIGPETEIPCYHDLNVLWIARYYALSDDPRARSLLERTAPYYPSVSSNEGRPEYYTDCWWKHYWADGAACGPEIIAGLTGDPQNKWLADRLLERQGPGADYKAIYAGMFYRTDVEAAALPNNYVRLDRNIGGPRGRFGDWYFAGTVGGGARDTFVGAMICRPDRPEPLDSALLAANIEVGLGGEGARDRTHLYLSGPDDRTSVAIGEGVAALGVRYSLRRPYINSVQNPDVPPTPWQATQVWLLTREGLVGLVELEATEEQTTPYLSGEIRLGPDQRARATDDPNLFACGELRVRLLEHNFASVTVGPARPGYAQTSTRHSALALRTSGDAHTARPAEPLRYAVLIAPASAGEARSFARLDAPGLWGFSIELAGRPLAVVFNPADRAATLRLPWPRPSAVVRADADPAATAQAREGVLDLRLRPVSLLLIAP